MNLFTELAGRTHPMLVHLPIGILLLALLILWLAQRERLEVSHGVVNVALASGTISALLACLTGWFLSRDTGHDAEAVDLHQWMAVFLTLACGAMWYLHYEYWLRDRVLYLVSGVVLVSLVATGHLGASLTHGSEYLIEPLTSPGQRAIDFQSLALADAKMYPDVIAPVLQAKCVSCHGPNKQKGKLRLDAPSFMLAGGKSGEVIKAGSLGDSELWHRIDLPRDHDDHMPPKSKPDLSVAEKTFIARWIESGAAFDAPLLKVITSEELQTLLREPAAATPEETLPQVAPADEHAVNSLLAKGASVVPIAHGSHLLSVNLVSAAPRPAEWLPALIQLAEQTQSLKLSGCQLTDAEVGKLGSFKNLQRLHVDGTQITDEGLLVLAQLHRLEYLNLKGTSVSARGVEVLKSLPRLQHLVLYHTNVDAAGRAALLAAFPKVQLEFGGYQVPTLASDTTVLQAPVR